MTYGTIVFGMVEENSPVGNPLVVRTITAGETIHIPTGAHRKLQPEWFAVLTG